MRKSRKGVIALCATLILNTVCSVTAFAAPADVTSFVDAVEEIPYEWDLNDDNLTQATSDIAAAKTAYNALSEDEKKESEVVAAKAMLDDKEKAVNVAKTLTTTTATRTDNFDVESITFSFDNTIDTLTIKDPTTGKVDIFKDMTVTLDKQYKRSIDLSNTGTYNKVAEIPFKHVQGKFGYEFPSLTDIWDLMVEQEFYIKNGLSGADDPKLDSNDPAYDDTLVPPTGSIGQPQAGWQLSEICIDGISYEVSDTFIPPQTVSGRGHDLEFKYVPSYTYNLDFNLDGGTTVGTAYKSATKASILRQDKWTVTISKNADGSFRNPPTKTGFAFKGFKLNGEDTLITDTFELDMTSGVTRTLTAVWEANGATTGNWMAHIEYDGNSKDGAAHVKSQDVEVSDTVDGHEFILEDIWYEWTGHNFLGWALTPGGTVAYKPGDAVEVPKTAPSIKFYGIWDNAGTVTPPEGAWTATVTYHDNVKDSTVEPKSESVAVSDGSTKSVKLAACSFTNEGYNFKNWNTKADGTGTSYGAGNDVTLTKDNPSLVLYAQWTAKPETWEAKIIYSLNGGQGSISEDVAQATGDNHEFTVKKPEGISKENCTFTGWNTKADGTGSSFSPDAKITVTKGAPTNELFAQWKETKKWTATIKYNANGGSGSIADQTQEVTDATTYSMTVKGIENITNSGNTFQYWNTKADGSGTQYAANSKWEAKEGEPTLELYAIWKKVDPWKATVKYNVNGGTGTVADTVVDVTSTDKQEVTLAKIGDVKKEGYTFKGWNTKADGTGTAYNAETKMTIYMAQPTIEVFAIWEAPKANADATGKDAANSGTGTNGTPVPKTDDTTNLPLQSVLLLLSLAGVAAMVGWEIFDTSKKKA